MKTSPSVLLAVVKSSKWFSFSQKDKLLLNSKLFFLNIILFLLTIVLIITFGIGFANASEYTTFFLGYKNIINNLPLYVRTIRSVGIFFMIWTVVVYLFILYKSTYLQSTSLKILSWLSIIPIINIFLIAYLSKDGYNKWLYLRSLFENDPLINVHNARKHWTYFVCLVGFIILTVYIPTTFYNAVVIKEGQQWKEYNFNLWFNSFIYFTVQSNYLCWISLGLYLINPNWKIFKGYTVFNWTLTYITMTGIVYNLGRFVYLGATGSNLTAGAPWYIILTGELAHVVNPITYVAVIAILICHRPVCKTNDLGFTMKFGIIIPLVYFFFLIISCFLTGISVYGPATNFLPSLILYNVSDTARGSYYVLIIYLIMAAMFLLTFYLYWLLIFKAVAKNMKVKISRANFLDLQNLKYQLNELTPPIMI